MDKKNKYWQLFLSTFKLSACTFGGGFVIIPLMRERFVKELRWIEEEEMLDLTAIAQSSPGSIAINASILVGYHVAGIPGALITVVGAALPPLIIISIISAFYQAFRSNKYVSMAMAGMLAGVAAVIFDVVINMAWPILKKKRWLPIAVMLAAFLATRFFSVNIILIILVCGVIGALDTLYLQKREDAAARDCFWAAYQAEANPVRKSSYLWQCVQCGVLLKAQFPALYGQFKQQLDRIVQDYPLMSLKAQDMAALELLNGIDAAFWFEDYEEILHLSKVLLQLGLSYMLTADERRMVDTAQALQSHLGQPDAHFRAFPDSTAIYSSPRTALSGTQCLFM